jgi:hypothetical protein
MPAVPRAGDALFNLADALLSESQAKSLAELSLSPSFQRKWPSVYAALQDGIIAIDKLRAVWMEALLADIGEDELVWIAVDSRCVERPDAETSEDRGVVHLSNLPLVDKAIGVGWTESTVVLLPKQACSWTPILDQQRVSTEQTPVKVAIAQLQALKPLCGKRRVLLLADRGYCTPEFLRACSELGISVIIRMKSDRKLYRPAVRLHKKGPMPKDGALFQGKRSETHAVPDAQVCEQDAQGRAVRTSKWDNLHFKEDRELAVKVIRVEREAAKNTKRDPRVSWFVMLDDAVALQDIASGYRLRFSEEHCYRFLKQKLLWTSVHVRTPEQFERWSWLVACVFNQLCLARDLGQACYRPWERKEGELSPGQVRRVMPTLLCQRCLPCSAVPTSRKSAWTRSGFPPKAGETLRRHRQKPQKDEKKRWVAKSICVNCYLC